jgi:rubredoxin
MVKGATLRYHVGIGAVLYAHISPSERILMKYVCQVCGYTYDPEVGDIDLDIAPGTAWEDLPEDFVCPLCGVGKDQFEAE